MNTRYSPHADEHNLVAADRPKRRYTYYVVGTFQFPHDMLRYDSAWPARGEDAAAMGEADGQTRTGRFYIKLHSFNPPTVDRWSSFNWAVFKPENVSSSDQ